MGTNNEEKRDKGQFVQFPLHLIYERKDLSRDDKWVLISIMGTYWTEGPHRLSYREVAALSGVPLALLTSYLDKKTGKQHEGILDRLARTGDIRITQNKDTNPLTGQPRGQTQSYIWVNYTRLWEQNAAYCETRKSVPNTNVSVPYTNTSVSDTNASVPNVNRSVPYTNDSVSVLPSEVPPIDYIDITDKEDTKDREESEGEQEGNATIVPSLSLGTPSHEIDNHSHCFFCSEDAELTCRVCGKGVCYDTHGRRFPLSETDIEDYCLPCLEARNAALEGDTHATATLTHRPLGMAADQPVLPGEATVSGEPAIPGNFGEPHGVQPVSVQAVPDARPEIDEEWCNAPTEHRLPAIPKIPSLSPAVEPGRSGGPTPVAPAAYHIPHVGDMTISEDASHEQNRDVPPGIAVEVDSGCTTPAPTPQVPPGVTPPRTMRATVVPALPKWDAQAMVARAEALRERPFSESARPKETKAARKLFARKPDLTEEEFTGAFQHWNTPWWHETNGPFCITDLAAVPKNKSEMRLIIALEKLAMPKKPPGGQVIQMPTTRGQQWRSSFDDPDYDMSAEFYPGTVAR